jgi:ATP-binding protein involved in chromosome partitioning
MNPFEKQAYIPGIKSVIAVGSGKGGVGKSTVSANLALALAALGKKVGLLDADIYGPSIPRLFGLLNQKPPLSPEGKILPHERYGVKLMSMGFLVGEDSALIWRGPMIFKALEQLLKDVAWGDLDILIMDLPPGTGDVPLTLAQKTPVSGAIAVTTPQNIALSDCKKSIDMFQKLHIPILGLVENMAQLFPKGELDSYLQKKGIQKLAELPFVADLAQSSEVGIPLRDSKPNSPIVENFKNLAQTVIHLISAPKEPSVTL